MLLSWRIFDLFSASPYWLVLLSCTDNCAAHACCVGGEHWKTWQNQQVSQTITNQSCQLHIYCLGWTIIVWLHTSVDAGHEFTYHIRITWSFSWESFSSQNNRIPIICAIWIPPKHMHMANAPIYLYWCIMHIYQLTANHPLHFIGLRQSTSYQSSIWDCLDSTFVMGVIPWVHWYRNCGEMICMEVLLPIWGFCPPSEPIWGGTIWGVWNGMDLISFKWNGVHLIRLSWNQADPISFSWNGVHT